MKRKETGQGLVEFALILVLVAIVVLAVLLLVGPAISNTFSDIICSIDPDSDYCEPSIQSGFINQSKQLGDGYTAGDEFEAFYEFRELSIEQEENLIEAVILSSEGIEEVFEVLLEYAIEINDDVLHDLISSALQEFATGKWEKFEEVLSTIFYNPEELPFDEQVWVSVILKAEPHIIDSYWVLEGTEVPYSAYLAALQDLEHWETQNSGSTGYTTQKLEEIWGLVDQRNSFIIEVARPQLKAHACSGISALFDTENEEYIKLAQQYAIQMPSCGY